MGILILEEGKHGVIVAALVHGAERVNYALNVLRRIQTLKKSGSVETAEKVRLKFALRALKEANEMVELGITLIEADLD